MSRELNPRFSREPGRGPRWIRMWSIRTATAPNAARNVCPSSRKSTEPICAVADDLDRLERSTSPFHPRLKILDRGRGHRLAGTELAECRGGHR
jgi:hypothetical protein